MMYFNNPYQNPYAVQPQQIVKVNGENGARAFQMPPNSSSLLLDESAPVVWLAQTDGAGYKTVTAYKIEPLTKPDTPDYGTLLTRIERLEERLNESNPAST